MNGMRRPVANKKVRSKPIEKPDLTFWYERERSMGSMCWPMNKADSRGALNHEGHDEHEGDSTWTQHSESASLFKLKAGKPITIVTMGDSLTDKRHWANREVCWVDLLRQGLKDAYRSDVTIVNPAIGGTQLRQNVILIPRWLATVPEPDLVTIFFGGNDRDSGMRGAEFRRTCTDAVNRVRRATRGKADVLLITTNPSAARWGAIEELAEACRDAAKDRRAGLADTDRAFVAAGRDNPNPLFVHDRVHLSKAGHAIVAETVIKAIEQEQNPKEKETVFKRSAAP